MRKRIKVKQLGRNANQRRALFKSLASALIKKGRIKTTLTKAKVLRPFIEKTLTKAGKEGLSSTRELRKTFSLKDVKLLKEKWAPLFKEAKGGYTRIIKLVPRKSDASSMAYIEFVKQPDKAKKVKKAKKVNKKNG